MKYPSPPRANPSVPGGDPGRLVASIRWEETSAPASSESILAALRLLASLLVAAARQENAPRDSTPKEQS